MKKTTTRKHSGDAADDPVECVEDDLVKSRGGVCREEEKDLHRKKAPHHLGSDGSTEAAICPSQQLVKPLHKPRKTHLIECEHMSHRPTEERGTARESFFFLYTSPDGGATRTFSVFWGVDVLSNVREIGVPLSCLRCQIHS